MKALLMLLAVAALTQAFGQGRPICPLPIVATLEWQEGSQVKSLSVRDIDKKVTVGRIPAGTTVILTAFKEVKVRGRKIEILRAKDKITLEPGSYLLQTQGRAKDGTMVFRTIFKFNTRA